MRLSLRSRTEPEVNLTSLIDVVLLLLIFFMVSTSFVKQSQISIRLPESEAPPVVDEEPERRGSSRSSYSSHQHWQTCVGRMDFGRWRCGYTT